MIPRFARLDACVLTALMLMLSCGASEAQLSSPFVVHEDAVDLWATVSLRDLMQSNRLRTWLMGRSVRAI